MGQRSHARAGRMWAGWAVGSALALGLAACVPPSPTRVVDQVNVGPTDIVDYVDGFICPETTWVSEVAQTFTAGRTGRLDRVSLNVRPITASSAPLSVSIRLVRPDGAPSEIVVGSGTYAGPGTPPFSDETVDVDLGAPAVVVAGLRYALVVGVAPVDDCPSTSVYGWSVMGTDDQYASGRLWSRGNLYNRSDWVPDEAGTKDLVFRTFVSG